MEWFRSMKKIDGKFMGFGMCASLIEVGVRDLRLHIANGLLAVLSANHSCSETCGDALRCLDACRAAFPLLSKSFVLELVKLWRIWTCRESDLWHPVVSQCCAQIMRILDVILPLDEAFLAARWANEMYDECRCRNSNRARFEAYKLKLTDLLIQAKEHG